MKHITDDAWSVLSTGLLVVSIGSTPLVRESSAERTSSR